MCICVKVMDLKIGFFFVFLLSLPLNVDNRFSKFDVKNYSSHVSLDYLPMHPPSPTYLPTHPFAYFPINLPTYVFTH